MVSLGRAWLVVMALAIGGAARVHAQGEPAPLPGLTDDEAERFEDGLEDFLEEEGAEDGLGPVFNGMSCAECHSIPVIGAGSDTTEIRFGRVVGRDFDPLTRLGGSLIQKFGIGVGVGTNCASRPFVGEVPPQQSVQAGRRTTSLLGLGLVDHVPDATFIQLASEQGRRTPATAGKVSRLKHLDTGATVVGKFGWKAQVSSLLDFAGDAYVNEMGITSPRFPAENCPQGNCELLNDCNPRKDINDSTENDPVGDDVRAFADFMTFLAPPARGPQSNDVKNGEKEFEKVGCSDCHVRELQTGPNASKAFNRVVFQPYSDFLLHDMGSLGDGISQGDANGRQMRTAPLWGLRSTTVFLHDGRASSVVDAIAKHQGQGAAARDAFFKRPAVQQRKILEFLNSL